MLEKVARAIYENISAGADDMESCIIAARAAIEAMREPTDAMVDAVWSKPDASGSRYPISGLRARYTAMIDAALLEQQP